MPPPPAGYPILPLLLVNYQVSSKIIPLKDIYMPIFRYIYVYIFACFPSRKKLCKFVVTCHIVSKNYPIVPWELETSPLAAKIGGSETRWRTSLQISHTLSSIDIVYTTAACFPCRRLFDIFCHRPGPFSYCCELSGVGVASLCLFPRLVVEAI